MSIFPKLKGVSKEKQESRFAKYLNFMRAVRPKEAINGGTVVMGRDPSHGRVRPNCRVFEHPTRQAGVDEATRLSQAFEGQTFEVWSCTHSVTDGVVTPRVLP